MIPDEFSEQVIKLIEVFNKNKIYETVIFMKHLFFY